MNIHIPKEIKERWPGYEFVGKPFKLKDGKTYIRAYSKFHMKKHFYCFEDDWIWHDWPVIESGNEKKLKD